jgi:protein-tyrosine phosphatase
MLWRARFSTTMEVMTRAEPPGEAAQPFRVSFVCTGNICRSPMAEVVMRAHAERAGLGNRLAIESAATGDWHVGEPADYRTIDALARAGYDGTHHRARQFDATDFPQLDLVVAFDRGQARILRNWAPSSLEQEKVRRLLEFEPELAALQDVPDPYYSDSGMFDQVLEMIERSTSALFRQLAPALRQGIR